MINLSTLRQISKKVISNPVKCVSNAMRTLRHSTFESSPAVDTFVKVNPQHYILGAKPKQLIKQLVAKDSSSIGKDAAVFSIPNYEDLVLRVEHSAIKNIESLGDDLKLIPIKHSKNIISKDNLGLPIYSVVGKDSEFYNKKFISPRQALSQKDNIMVLKKVTGEHPAKGAFDALIRLMGFTEGEPNVPQYINFNQLGFIKANYGEKAAKKCLDIMKNGGEQTIPPNYLINGSEEFTFVNCETFVENYRNYVDTFLSYLKDVSKMPKTSYKEAVDTIIMDKDFLIDFQHTNNTFVDLKKQKFNFMDFEYDRSNAKYIYENPVKEFRNVLLGKCFSRDIKNPASLLFEEKDIKAYKEYCAKITGNVNSVSPDKYKF